MFTALLQSSVPFTLLSGGPVSPPPSPPPPVTTSNVLKCYRMVGWPGVGGNQGDTSSHGGHWYRFRAAATGFLTHLCVFTQGARPNADWGDLHGKGNGGTYNALLYRYTKTSFPDGDIGAAADRVLLGQTKGTFRPSKPKAGSGRFNPDQTSPADQGSAHPQGQGDGYLDGLAEVAFQSWQAATQKVRVKATAKRDDKGASGEPPTGWASSSRYWGTGYILIPIYRNTGTAITPVWELGVEVEAGDVLLYHYKNENASPNSHYTHDNALHLRSQPVARSDGLYEFPQDDASAVFNSAGGTGRDWRKQAALAQIINGAWYGSLHNIVAGDTGWPRDGGSNISKTLWVREVITPQVGYTTQTCRNVWIWAWKLTGSGGNTSSGNLQVAIWRAKLPDGNKPVVWFDLTGWKTFPTDTFKECTGHPHSSQGGTSNYKPTTKDQVFCHGLLDLGVDIDVENGYHYAIVTKVEAGKDAIYATSGMISTTYLLNRNRPSFQPQVDATTVFPTAPPMGNAGRNFNCGQSSSNSSTATLSSSESAPSSPAVGKLWYKPSTQVLTAWNGSEWVALNPAVSATAPGSPEQDDLWFDTSSSTLKQFVGTTWRAAALNGTWSYVHNNQTVLPYCLEPIS